MALSRYLRLVRDIRLRDCLVVPSMNGIIHPQIVGDGTTELDDFAVDVRASEKIVVAHPLEQVLHMALIGLQRFAHNRTLS